MSSLVVRKDLSRANDERETDGNRAAGMFDKYVGNLRIKREEQFEEVVELHQSKARRRRVDHMDTSGDVNNHRTESNEQRAHGGVSSGQDAGQPHEDRPGGVEKEQHGGKGAGGPVVSYKAHGYRLKISDELLRQLMQQLNVDTNAKAKEGQQNHFDRYSNGSSSNKQLRVDDSEGPHNQGRAPRGANTSGQWDKPPYPGFVKKDSYEVFLELFEEVRLDEDPMDRLDHRAGATAATVKHTEDSEAKPARLAAGKAESGSSSPNEFKPYRRSVRDRSVDSGMGGESARGGRKGLPSPHLPPDRRVQMRKVASLLAKYWQRYGTIDLEYSPGYSVELPNWPLNHLSTCIEWRILMQAQDYPGPDEWLANGWSCEQRSRKARAGAIGHLEFIMNRRRRRNGYRNEERYLVCPTKPLHSTGHMAKKVEREIVEAVKEVTKDPRTVFDRLTGAEIKEAVHQHRDDFCRYSNDGYNLLWEEADVKQAAAERTLAEIEFDKWLLQSMGDWGVQARPAPVTPPPRRRVDQGPSYRADDGRSGRAVRPPMVPLAESRRPGWGTGERGDEGPRPTHGR